VTKKPSRNYDLIPSAGEPRLTACAWTISNQSPSSPLTPPAGSGFGQSTSAPSLSGLRAEQTRSEVGEALDRGRAGIAESASAARDSLAEDVSRLRDDVASPLRRSPQAAMRI